MATLTRGIIDVPVRTESCPRGRWKTASPTVHRRQKRRRNMSMMNSWNVRLHDSIWRLCRNGRLWNGLDSAQTAEHHWSRKLSVCSHLSGIRDWKKKRKICVVVNAIFGTYKLSPPLSPNEIARIPPQSALFLSQYVVFLRNFYEDNSLRGFAEITRTKNRRETGAWPGRPGNGV